jgi:hypothetical protein
MLVRSRELYQIYKKAIGQGATLCLMIGCRMAHQSKDITVNPGALQVMNSATSAFVDPSLAPGILEPELFAQWKSQASTLGKWCRLSTLASTLSFQEEPASKAILKVKELFAVHAEATAHPQPRGSGAQ